MATAAYNATIRATSQPSIAFTDEAMTDSGDHTTYTITNAAKQFLDRDVAVVTQARYDEIQTVTITGGPTGGTFTLTFGANTTTGIAYNAAASAVQSALVALASIGAGNATVSGSAGGPYTVDFTGSLGYTAQSLLTASGASLTGGSSPGVAIARVKGGATWATITTGFTLYRVYARVTFAVVQATTTQARLHSGNYYAIITIGNAKTAAFAGKMTMDNTTVFSTDGSESAIPTTFSGTLKLGTVWLNTTRVKSLNARDLLILDFSVAGDKYSGYCYATDSDIKTDPKKAHTEDLTFLLTDEFFES
jgi:hypothetical protein